MKKVVIIGAGPAGLAAAYKLLTESKEYKVIILEEENKIGGISKTINYHGNRIDIGGHRFFTKSKEVLNFWKEILPVQGKDSFDDKKLKRKKELPKTKIDPDKEDKVFLIRNRISRIFYENKLFNYPISLNLKTIKNLGVFRTIICGFSYIKTKIIKKKEKSLEDFYINRFGKKLYSIFFKDYTKKVWGRSPKNISKEWGYQRVKGISLFEVIKDYFNRLFKIKNKKKETSLIEKYLYPKYGPGQLYEEIAKKVKKLGGKVLTNSKVIKIKKKNNKITEVVYINNNKEIVESADYVISSMPLKDLCNSLNNIPKNILTISNNLPYRDFITVGVLTDKLLLKNKTKIKTFNDNIPDCWLYVQDTNVKLGRIQVFNNWSPYMVKDIYKTTWIGLEYFCNENDSFWNLSDTKIKQLAIKELQKLKVINDNILDSCVIRIKKAYPAYFDSYKDIDQLKDYLNKIDNLYCIGRNGQHRYNNMDHSIMTAFKAVNNIINNIKDKDEIWNVNIEKKYHEEEE